MQLYSDQYAEHEIPRTGPLTRQGQPPPLQEIQAMIAQRFQIPCGRHRPYRLDGQQDHLLSGPTSCQHISPNTKLCPIYTHLALQDKLCQLPAINPMQPSNHGQTTGNPPTITHILKLLRPPIQPPSLHLSFTKPSAQLISIHYVQSSSNA